MADLKRDREHGRRRDAKHGGKSLMAPTLGVHTSELGEHRLNIKQVYALETMWQTHPAVQAARTVLHSQLLSGGLKLMRGGEALKEVRFGDTDANGARKRGVTRDWAQHLDEHWLPFAREVIDCFLKWGVCPVTLDIVEEDVAVEAIRRLKREVGVAGTAKRKAVPATPVIVPYVPQLGTYEIAWQSTGKYGYTRKYVMYNNAPGHATRLDEEALVFVRQHPDSVGNINSPLATVYEQGSFVAALTELAFTAEIARSHPQIITQLRKPDKGTHLDAGALFFDAESRNAANDQEGEQSSQAARALEMQARLCDVINKLQTRGVDQSAGGGTAATRQAFMPPDVPPKLFTLPKEHELAPNVQMPQPRTDLEALMRLGMDQFCSALGIPAALVFEGRFSNNSTAQLQLLNSTVSQLSKAVNHVLTKTYNYIYADDDDEGEEPAQLKLQTAPLAASEEVEKLFGAQIIDMETALPAALHALGASPDEIEKAVERGREKEERRCSCEDEDRAMQKRDADMNIKERTLGLKKTEADIKKTEHDATKAPSNASAIDATNDKE